jgi:hypothetical protein
MQSKLTSENNLEIVCKHIELWDRLRTSYVLCTKIQRSVTNVNEHTNLEYRYYITMCVYTDQ